MTALAIVSMISMLGWLILVSGELKSHDLPRRKLIQMALLWIGIFAALAAAFSGIR